MSKPRLLDLFCGAGGAARGYQMAGFHVTGVDIKPQPRYAGDVFIQGDAMTFPLEGFDAIHASPPCQGESIMRNLPWLRDREYPMLIIPTRERLQAQTAPWVIENVQNARRSEKKPHGMQGGWLCGQMFGLPLYRHRIFETNWAWLQPGHPRHSRRIHAGRMLGGRARAIVYTRPDGSVSTLSDSIGGHRSNAEHAAAAAGMGIDWMKKAELTEAIPPAYTLFLGKALLAALAVQP